MGSDCAMIANVVGPGPVKEGNSTETKLDGLSDGDSMSMRLFTGCDNVLAVNQLMC